MPKQTRRRALQTLAIGGSIGFAGCIGSLGSEEAQGLTITWADHWPEENAVIADQGTRHFMDLVEEKSDGEIQFDYQTGGQLGGPEEYIELVDQGTIDIGPMAPQYSSDTFPLSEVGVLPSHAEDIDDGTQANWDLLSPDKEGFLYENEWNPNGFVPVCAYCSEPYSVLLQGDAISSVDEIEGKRIRSSGGVTDWTLEALGAVPVQMGAADGYTALERGTLDGDNKPIDGITGYSLQEVTDHIITNANTDAFIWVDAMSTDTWNELSSDHKDIFTEAAEETIQNYIDAQLKSNEETLEALKEDLEHLELPSSEVEEWNSRMEDVTDTWMQNANDSEAAQEALDAFTSALSNYQG